MSAWRPLGWSLLFGIGIATSMTYLAAASKPGSEESKDKYETKVETRLIGDYTTFSGLQPLVLEGVGLVVGLNGTGGDPAPSFYRTELMEDLKRRGVPNPNAILQSPNTALVLVRAHLPPLMKKGDVVDVEVRVPDSADATSLAGGWLMETYLSEQAFVPGRAKPLEGHTYAKAQGAILTSAIGSDTKSPELLKRGRVLGGATVVKERELGLYLRYDFRSIRNANRISQVISKRFHDFNKYGTKQGMAVAKTDQKIVLTVHPRYKDNYPRYLQVIRHMVFNEDAVGSRIRMQKLQEDIFNAERAEATALELEAIGNDTIPVLKEALTSPLLEVRFHAAAALAYLGSSDGLAALKEAAQKERAFRVFALSAIAALDDAEAHLALRDLMNEPSDEARYGAFRALWTLDKRDPFIRGEALGIREEEEEKPSRNAGKYMLHALQTEGDEVVHALTRTRPEIVLFGANQLFKSPIYLSAGRNIIVTSQPGASTVSLAKFEAGKPDQRRETSLQVADVIRAADELGATYPDIVQMLADASAQKNLPTRLAIDELPEGGRVYYRPDTSGDKSKKRKVKVGRDNMTPNLFPENEEPSPTTDRKKTEGRGNMANVPSEKSGRKESEAKVKETELKSKDAKDSDKPKGLFSWLGGWRKADR